MEDKLANMRKRKGFVRHWTTSRSCADNRLRGMVEMRIVRKEGNKRANLNDKVLV